MDAIAYDDSYTGPAVEPEEGERLAQDHRRQDRSCSWPTTASPRCGETVAQAYDRLYYVERAAQVQIYAMWTGQPPEAAARAGG